MDDKTGPDAAVGTLSEIARASLRRNLEPHSLTGHFAKGAFLDYVMMAPFGSQPSMAIFLSASAMSLIVETSLPVARRIGVIVLQTSVVIVAQLFDTTTEIARPDAIRAMIAEADQEWLTLWRSLSEGERQRRVGEERLLRTTNTMIAKSLRSGRGPGLLLV